MFTSILVALDGSNQANDALAAALAIVRMSGAFAFGDGQTTHYNPGYWWQDVLSPFI